MDALNQAEVQWLEVSFQDT